MATTAAHATHLLLRDSEQVAAAQQDAAPRDLSVGR